MHVCACGSVICLSRCECDITGKILTEQYDDADEYGDDGPGSQASRRHGPERGAVSVLVAGTHLHFDDRPVGQRRVPRVRHNYRDLIHPWL